MKKTFAMTAALLAALAVSAPAFADKGGIPNENASDKAKGNTGGGGGGGGGGGNGNGHTDSNGKGHDKATGKHADKWHS